MCNLKAVREKAGITQAALAESIGMTQGAIAHYETGRRRPGLDECRLIIAALRDRGVECNLDDVFPAKPGEAA